jgi:hypothetical protein
MHVTSSGTIEWAVRAGGTGEDQAKGIAPDGSGGALLVTGYFAGTASFGTTTLTGNDAYYQDVRSRHRTGGEATGESQCVCLPFSRQYAI